MSASFEAEKLDLIVGWMLRIKGFPVGVGLSIIYAQGPRLQNTKFLEAQHLAVTLQTIEDFLHSRT
jgi:hypothetical protein